jgi:YggT family protein
MTPMGVFATTGLLADLESSLQSFVTVFVSIYVIFIVATIILSYVRLPYSRTSSAVQEFLDDVVRPYLRLFRFLPRLGPFDLSPMVGIIVLFVAAGLVNALIGAVL